MRSAQSQPECVPAATTSAAEPSVSEWVPPVDIGPMVTLKAKAIGSIGLKPRRANPKRGRVGGKRYVAMWKVTGDDTFFIELGAGEHVQRLRLSGDALDAIAQLHAQHGGSGRVWKLIYRVVTKKAADGKAASPAIGPTQAPDDPIPPSTQPDGDT